jgi:hypothetical protein
MRKGSKAMRSSTSEILRALTVAFVFLLSLLPASAFVADDVHWDVQFGTPGTTNDILAIALNGGNLYVAGYGSTSPTLKMWDGGQWSTVGTFTNSSGAADIYDLAFVGSGLYAAGSFTQVNGVAANGLAQWNGTSWTALSFQGTALCLTVSGNNLYVGGLFTNLDGGGVMMTNIGMWDGSAWHALGNGLGVANSALVRAVVASAGLVYAGGSFTNSGPQAATNLAVWNGSTWTAVGGGVNGIVYSLVLNGGTLYAAGGFTQAGSVPASYVAAWNGANWSALAGGLGGTGNSMAAFNNLICVTGSFATAGGIAASNFATWNGTSWSAAGTGFSSTGLRVVATATNVFVGGIFASANGVTVNGIASWDGAQWSPVGTPGRMNGVAGFVFALATDETNWFAGGIFNYAGLVSATNIARFDGTNWHPMGAGISPPGGTTSVDAIATSNNNVYVGGSFAYAGNAQALNMARWDGTNWYGLALGPGGAVASVTVRPDGIYAAGAQLNGGVYNDPFLSRWDGTNWNGVLAYNPTNTFETFYINDPHIGMDAVAFQGTNIFVAGHFIVAWHDPTFTYITNCSNIMRFDGTYAQIMRTGLDSNVLTMAVLGTNLYVGGLFDGADFAPANRIAMWDGSNWHSVGGGVVGNGTVSALATIGNDLYAAGSFTNMGGVSASLIAKWDGTNWSALGSGISGRSGAVDSLAAAGSDLFAGGYFRTAGITDAYDISHWNSQANFDLPQLFTPAWLGPGQFQTRLFGIAGLTNIIQSSTDVASWTAVFTNSAGVYEFADTNATNPHRFYRAVLGP